MFDSTSFSSLSFDPRSWFGLDSEATGIRPSGGIPARDYRYHPWMRPVGDLRKKKRELVAEIPQPVVTAAQEAIEKAVRQRYERQTAIDVASAEQELRAALALMQVQWQEQMRRLLLLEYQIYMAELEEASIAMLLFEM